MHIMNTDMIPLAAPLSIPVAGGTRRLCAIALETPQRADLAWVVPPNQEPTVMDELTAVWESRRTLVDAIQRLSVLGCHPTARQCNALGRSIVVRAGCAMVATDYETISDEWDEDGNLAGGGKFNQVSDQLWRGIDEWV